MLSFRYSRPLGQVQEKTGLAHGAVLCVEAEACVLGPVLVRYGKQRRKILRLYNSDSILAGPFDSSNP